VILAQRDVERADEPAVGRTPTIRLRAGVRAHGVDDGEVRQDGVLDLDQRRFGRRERRADREGDVAVDLPRLLIGNELGLQVEVREREHDHAAADRETPDRPTDRGADVRGDAIPAIPRPCSALPTRIQSNETTANAASTPPAMTIACVPAMSVIALTTSSRLNQNVIQRYRSGQRQRAVLIPGVQPVEAGLDHTRYLGGTGLRLSTDHFAASIGVS